MFDEEKVAKEEYEKVKKEAEEALKAKADLEAREADLKAKLEKLQDKEFNFKRLRDMTEEEMSKLTSTEIALRKEQEKLSEDQQKFKQSMLDTYKAEAVDRLSNGDEEVKKKILAYYDEFKGDAEDKNAIFARAQKAAQLASPGVQVSPTANLLGGFSGEGPKKQEKTNFAETDAGKSLASALNLGISKQK